MKLEMNGTKHIIILFILSLLVTGLNGQEFGSNAKSSIEEESVHFKQREGFKPEVTVSLGTSFTSFGPGYNMFGNWIMPEFTVPVSKKFSVRAGIGYSNMYFSTPNSEGTLFQQNNNLQMGTVYVSGIYSVNNKLTIYGTAYKTFDLKPVAQNEINPRALDLSEEGVMLNLDYKVNENFRFNVGISYQRQNPYNYMYAPGGFYGSPSLFGNPAFMPAFGPGF
jgi:hypothetical protein